MLRAIATAACAAATLLASAPTLASTVNASTVMSNIAIQLVDLDPNDGIAPSITFLNGLNWSMGTLAINTLTGIGHTDTQHGPVGLMSVASSAVDTPGTSATALTWGDPMLNGGSLAGITQADRYGNANANSAIFSSLVLSANTQMTLSGHVVFNGSTTTGGEEAMGYYGLTLQALTDAGYQYENSEEFFFVRPADEESPLVPHVGFEDRMVNVTLTNAGKNWTSVSLNCGIVAGATSNLIQTIPEPQAWALMPGGLALIAFVAARKRDN